MSSTSVYTTLVKHFTQNTGEDAFDPSVLKELPYEVLFTLQRQVMVALEQKTKDS